MSGRGRPSLFPAGVRSQAGDLIELSCAVALTVLGVVGFRTAFGGSAFLLVGVVGAAAGAAVGYLIARARLPLLVGTATGIVGFFVVGAVVLRPDSVAGVIPTPATFAALLGGAVNGWAKLITAVPLVGNSRELLVIPFLCGYAGAIGAGLLALLVPRFHACVLAPMGVLALSVLFGVNEPAALLLQGGVFGAVAIGWMSYRETRKRTVVVDGGRVRRQAVGAALLTVSAAGAIVLGPNLPLADSRERFVLRDRNEPPFDPSQLPSPLISFRRYLDEKGAKLKDEVLFTVTAEGGAALPERSKVRLAVMDGYDGVVWAVTGGGSDIGGSFQRVGERISGDPVGLGAGGQVVDLTVEIKALGTRPSVWMPLVGVVDDVQFKGARATELAESFRFNRVSGGAALPIRLVAGDTYRLTTRLAPEPTREEVGNRPPADHASSATPDLPDAVIDTAGRRTEGATDTRSKVEKLERWLKDGFYSDGGELTGVPPGHSISRLAPFLEADQPIGNGEQYAAALALMARTLGLPARVVMGFVVPVGSTGPTVELRGRDVDAWVEVAFDGVGWVAFHPTPDKSRVPAPDAQTRAQPKREEASAAAPPPPPSTVPPPTADFDEPEDPPARKGSEKTGVSAALPRVVVVGAAVLGAPFGALGLLAGAVVGLKARRRKRRRLSGGPANRISGAWSELVDHARDLGQPVPRRATRLELTPFLTVPGSVDIARATDAALFGVHEPTDAEADALWKQVESALEATVAPLPKAARARAAINLTSLRPG